MRSNHSLLSLVAFAVVLLAATAHPATAQTITTIAGTGTAGFNSDGIAATSAQLNTPYDVAVDALGNIIIADYNNSRIRKVDAATGNITTIAGTGVNGFSGDGGPAISARVAKVAGVFLDRAGNLFIADAGGNRIRKIDASSGDITTVAGTGTGAFGGDGAAATLAQIATPNAVVTDAAGNVYIADYANDRIRKVDTATGDISTIAGTATAGFSGDGGPANLAQISGPTGIALDAQGNLFFSDLFNNRVRKIDLAGDITTVAGTGSATFNGDGIQATNASLAGPRGLAVDGLGRIFIADATHRRIRLVDTNGIISTYAGTGTTGFSGDGGPATAAEFGFPSGVQVDTNGNVYVTDQSNHRIRRISAPPVGSGGGGAPTGSVGPLAHWRFDEPPGATTAADSAGTFNGTLSATGASFVSGGRAGNALSVVQGANGFVDFGDNFNFPNQDFSVVAWVRTAPGDTNTFSNFLSKHNANTANGYILSYNHSTIAGSAGKAFFYAGTRTIPSGGFTVVDVPVSTTSVNDGNWHQVVGVYRTSGTTTVYVDGAPFEGSILSSAVATNSAPFLIGGFNSAGAPTSSFTGSVDDVQIYNRALSDGEINFLFANPGLEIVPTTVTGTVRNAVNGQPLPGASVSVNGGTPVITSATGTFTVTNVPSGSATVQATATGFFTYTNSFTLAPVPNNTIGFSLSPTISGASTVRLVLNWGASPSDLDSHLETPVIGGQAHHVYFVNRGSTNFAPFAELDVDDVTGFGPETITINTLSAGTYHYYIHNFSGSPGFNVSGATAQIYTSAGLVATVSVPTTNSTGSYWYVARIDGSSGTITVVNSISSTVPVVIGAPSITSSPQNVITNQGSTAVFSVTASGNAPLTYQWRFNGTNILGANNSVLALFNVQPANAGQYDCVVNNAVGSATSSPATLTVNAVLPVITSQPAGFRVLPGTNVAFSVAATGPGPFTYQWRFNGANIIGATNALLTLSNVQPANSGAYSVAVNNSFGTTLSTAGNLEVLTPPVISVHPQGRSVAAGDVVNFSVVHSGSQPFTYQWQINGVPVPAATNSSLNLFNVQFLQAGNYSVVISNDAGGVISSNALLQVTSPPIITAQPVPRTALAGRAATFSAGVIGSPVLAYQWRVNGTNISGANASSYTLAAAQVSDRGLYSLVITNVFGSVTSAPAFLAVHPVAVLPGWVNQAGGAGADVGNACATDGAGNLYVAGYFTETASFGTNALISAGLSDLFVAKYDNAGALLWVRRAGGPGFDTANGIAVDTLGNCYVTGAFEAVAGFGTNSLVNTDAASFTDIFVTKLDTNGNFVWVRGTGVKGVSDAGQAVALDSSGNVLVAGRSGQITFGGSPVAGAGRIFLAKYGSAGNALWARAVGLAGSGGALDSATGVGTDASGRIHLAGNFEGPQATFGTATLTNRGLSDGFLALFDANGVPQRVVQIGGAGNDKVNALAVDAAGNAHVGGHFSGSLTLGAVGSLIPADVGLTSSGQIDAFVAQFDSSGSLAWANKTGGSGPDSVRGLALGPNGTVHVTGYFSGTASFGTNTLVSSGATLDVFTARYTSTGQPSFAQQSGGNDLSGDYGNAIAVDSTGNSFVTGQFSGGATLGTGQTDSSGGGDVFLTRFNAPQETPPQVNFRISGGNLILTWPVAANGWGLQDAPTNPVPAGWRGAPHTITVVGEEYVVTIPLSGQKGFFRLVR